MCLLGVLYEAGVQAMRLGAAAAPDDCVRDDTILNCRG